VVAYGAIQAVRGVSFDVEKGQIVSLIGSNGAGKTTTLRTVSGLLRAVSGEGLLAGEPIHPVAPPRGGLSGRAQGGLGGGSSSRGSRSTGCPRTRSWPRGSRTAPRAASCS